MLFDSLICLKRDGALNIIVYFIFLLQLPLTNTPTSKAEFNLSNCGQSSGNSYETGLPSPDSRQLKHWKDDGRISLVDIINKGGTVNMTYAMRSIVLVKLTMLTN